MPRWFPGRFFNILREFATPHNGMYRPAVDKRISRRYLSANAKLRAKTWNASLPLFKQSADNISSWHGFRDANLIILFRRDVSKFVFSVLQTALRLDTYQYAMEGFQAFVRRRFHVLSFIIEVGIDILFPVQCSVSAKVHGPSEGELRSYSSEHTPRFANRFFAGERF